MTRYTQLLIPPVTAVLIAAVLLSDRTPAPPALDEPTEEERRARAAARVLRRSLARDRLAREVADGRRSVVAAAALFRALDRADPPLTPVSDLPPASGGDDLPVIIPGASEAEAYCRRVVKWAYLAVHAEAPDRAAAVARRLADEVRAEVGSRGSVALPDPAGLADEAERLIAEVEWVPAGPARDK